VTGTVYLVGAGPGDPGLVTLRAAELLRRADAVVHDEMVHPDVVAMAERAERVFVGRRGGRLPTARPEIERLLVELAGRHEAVVRLVGGDPFVFGRGSEEALALLDAGVPFEVVPGITAGIAAAAYAGIPVTHPGLSGSVAFVTGHGDPASGATEPDWTHLARGVGTVVFYTDVDRMGENFRRLVEAGRDPATPAAAIEWGTYGRQRTVEGTLATLPGASAVAGIAAPSLIVVGDVVRLRERLGWWEGRPLSGRTVVVTRARAQSGLLAASLARMGAEVVRFPTIVVEAAEDSAPLERAAREAGAFDWIVFTSGNAVDHFWGALERVGADSRTLGGVRVCAVGPATATALSERGVRADLVPSEALSERALDALLAAGDPSGARVLLPRARDARPVLADGLRAAGAEVVEVEAYRTVRSEAGAEELAERLRSGGVDLVTFTSGSTVRGFTELVGRDLGGARVATIGPITSAVARELGIEVDIEARDHSVEGLLRAIAAAAGDVA
jgi:uroporphyrinogen III methyltransferase / synthase